MSSEDAKTASGLVASSSNTFLDTIAQSLQHAPLTGKVYMRKLKNKKILASILGAAQATNPELVIDPDTMEEMTDPYQGTTRSDFSSMAHTDPCLSQALKNRNNAFFKNGFTLELQPKSKKDQEAQSVKGKEREETDKQIADPDRPTFGAAAFPPKEEEEIAKELDPLIKKIPGIDDEEEETEAVTAGYEKYLQQIEDWTDKPHIDLLAKMKAANMSSATQGRSVTLIFPALTKLPQGELPESLKSLSYEDVGNPIIDINTWTLVGIRLNNLEPKMFALPEEMIHIERDAWADRKGAANFGMSNLEAVVQASKIYKKIINYDMAKAAVAGYMTKLLLTVPLEGLKDPQRTTILQSMVTSLVTNGTDVVAVEGNVEFTPVPVSVDTPMIDMLESKLADILIAHGGSTKSQMGRTDNLNRDNATIQEIAFIKYRREPDEELVKTAIENQILNPMLAHLAGLEFDKMPVKVVILRKEQEDDEIDDVMFKRKGQTPPQFMDPNMINKEGEIDAAGEQDDKQAFKQKGSRSTFGASGMEELKEEEIRSKIEMHRAIQKKAEQL